MITLARMAAPPHKGQGMGDAKSGTGLNCECNNLQSYQGRSGHRPHPTPCTAFHGYLQMRKGVRSSGIYMCFCIRGKYLQSDNMRAGHSHLSSEGRPSQGGTGSTAPYNLPGDHEFHVSTARLLHAISAYVIVFKPHTNPRDRGWWWRQ